MQHENLFGLGAGQRLDIGCVDPPVPVQIHAQLPHRPDGHAMIGRATGIVGVIHIATLAGDDLSRDFFDTRHSGPLESQPSERRKARKVIGSG